MWNFYVSAIVGWSLKWQMIVYIILVCVLTNALKEILFSDIKIWNKFCQKNIIYSLMFYYDTVHSKCFYLKYTVSRRPSKWIFTNPHKVVLYVLSDMTSYCTCQCNRYVNWLSNFWSFRARNWYSENLIDVCCKMYNIQFYTFYWRFNTNRPFGFISVLYFGGVMAPLMYRTLCNDICD